MHLTNYAINKESENYIFNLSDKDDNYGHKRHINHIWDYLHDKGHDVDKIKDDIKLIIIKTIISVQPSLAHIYRSAQPNDQANNMCFEILGFDILLDHRLKCWLLEINHSPSFNIDTPLDSKIKGTVIRDTLNILYKVG